MIGEVVAMPRTSGAILVQVESRDAGGMRVRVRGLLGCPAMARWIDGQAAKSGLPAGVTRVRASSDTGIVRIAGAGGDDVERWLRRCVASFFGDRMDTRQQAAALRPPPPPSARKPLRPPSAGA
jgi:hypothetical protein